MSRTVIALALAATLAGCGGGGANESKQVRATMAEFTRAAARKDYSTLCTRVLAPALVSRLTQIGLPCETALARGLGGVVSPLLVVRSVAVHGTTALARVHTGAANQPAYDTTVELVKTGGRWYVRALDDPAASAP